MGKKKVPKRPRPKITSTDKGRQEEIDRQLDEKYGKKG